MAGPDLQRFVVAQDGGGTFDAAMGELAAGRKVTHWMWFVFPQIAGLGTSPTARSYELASVGQAVSYLTHPVLGPRLLDATRRVLDIHGDSAVDIFGTVDTLKFRSSMTLFLRADPDQPLFARAIDRFFAGVPDRATDELIARVT